MQRVRGQRWLFLLVSDCRLGLCSQSLGSRSKASLGHAYQMLRIRQSALAPGWRKDVSATGPRPPTPAPLPASAFGGFWSFPPHLSSKLRAVESYRGHLSPTTQSSGLDKGPSRVAGFKMMSEDALPTTLGSRSDQHRVLDQFCSGESRKRGPTVQPGDERPLENAPRHRRDVTSPRAAGPGGECGGGLEGRTPKRYS